MDRFLHSLRVRVHARWALASCLTLALVACGGPARPPAADVDRAPAPGSARTALRAAEAAASAWMRDAALIYLENDDLLGREGEACAWGFLFRSELGDAWRVIAVRGGRVAGEGPLGFPFAAPILPPAWIDSGAAIEAAEGAGGREFRLEAGAELRHAVLGRGVFTGWSGPPTWMVIYRSAERGELAIVIDATDGKVLTRLEG